MSIRSLLQVQHMIPAEPGWRALVKQRTADGFQEIEEPIIGWACGVDRWLAESDGDVLFDDEADDPERIPTSFDAVVVSADWIALARDLPGEFITYLPPGIEAETA